MLLFKKVSGLQTYLHSARLQGNNIGFVPTMGALHEGHLSLIQASQKENQVTVCSIFVNPTQFNESSDLDKYPRTPEKDIGLLLDAGCEVLFMPPVAEIYPENHPPFPVFDFGYLDQPMEGAHRPGHFTGVAQVVYRLLEIVQPDALYMGQKDFQQFSIIQSMLKQLNSGIRLVRCPIVREADGLAMSSRNVRLNAEQRQIAPHIYRTLITAKNRIRDLSPTRIATEAMRMLSDAGMKPEYFRIVDGYTLRDLDSFDDASLAVACTAVQLGDVRLIDNLVLFSEEEPRNKSGTGEE